MTDASRTPFEDAAAGAVMIPMLPCADVDAMLEFWGALGLECTYRQLRPNPYVALRAGAIDLHYYGLDGWDPENSHSTCGIVVTDPRPLYERFRQGLRDLYGKVPLRGFPRITRPRERANNAGLSGFSVVDPGGNWIRVSRAPESSVQAGENATVSWTTTASTALGRALENAVVIGDSHGDVPQARKVLAGALARSTDRDAVVDRARALAYLVELELRAGDADAARRAFAELEALPYDDGGVTAAAIAEARETLAGETGA